MNQHLKNLKQHQKWRRDGKVAAMHPEDVGAAIDYAIAVCEAAENLVAVKGRHHSDAGLGAWISVEERRPKQNVLLAVLLKNSGKYAIRRGCYYEKFEEETNNEDFYDHNEADDTDYVPEGWYEAIANWDEWTTVSINEGTVTHWMPLPEAPNAELRGCPIEKGKQRNE